MTCPICNRPECVCRPVARDALVERLTRESDGAIDAHNELLEDYAAALTRVSEMGLEIARLTRERDAARADLAEVHKRAATATEVAQDLAAELAREHAHADRREIEIGRLSQSGHGGGEVRKLLLDIMERMGRIALRQRSTEEALRTAHKAIDHYWKLGYHAGYEDAKAGKAANPGPDVWSE